MIPIASQYRILSYNPKTREILEQNFEKEEFRIQGQVPVTNRWQTVPILRNLNIKSRCELIIVLLKKEYGMVISHHSFRYVNPTTNQCDIFLK